MCEWRTIAKDPTADSWAPSALGLPLESPGPLGMTDGEEVERALEIGLELAPEREVGGGDRGDEAVVEGLREPKRRVDTIPAGAQRQLVKAELAGVEEAEEVDRGEVRGE